MKLSMPAMLSQKGPILGTRTGWVSQRIYRPTVQYDALTIRPFALRLIGRTGVSSIAGTHAIDLIEGFLRRYLRPATRRAGYSIKQNRRCALPRVICRYSLGGGPYCDRG